MSKRDWANDPLDMDYLVDSGLLFKINQTVTHLFGIGIGIKTGEDGKKTFAFADSRKKPEDLVFSEGAFEMAESKYERFRDEFGGSQIVRRQQVLGSACQNYKWSRKREQQ